MEKSKSSIAESREALMISPTGEGDSTMRTANFLEPSITSIEGPVFRLPSHSLSSLPPTFEPKNWPLSVNFCGWRCPHKNWKTWVAKMAYLHGPTWRKAGIYQAILNSTFEIHRNNDLVFGVAERWCPETKSFIFPWGEATITLEDVMMISGCTVLGSPVFSPLEMEELKETEEKLNDARQELVRTTAKKACVQMWMKKFMESGSEIEHEAFLVFWLSRYIFPTARDSISRLVFPIAIHIARGNKIALAPAILARIYRDLSLLKGNIVESTMLENKQGNGDVLTVSLWSPFQLVQIWAWERFVELQPKPNLINDGEPRLARWDKLKHDVDNVRLVLESAKKRFNWRPYTKTVKNWDFPKFYGENEMWVTVDIGFDEELMSFVRCLRVSVLVGLDCIEQYLPHRVAMQFGFDQDLPGCVGQSNENPEIAWSDYSNPIDDGKLYIPSRSFEACVTTRYMKWWKQSMQGLQGAREGVVEWQKHLMYYRFASENLKGRRKGAKVVSSFNITSKSSKEKKTNNSSKRLKKTEKSCNGVKHSVPISNFRKPPKVLSRITKDDSFISSFKITPKSSKEAKEGDGAFTIPSLPPKTLQMSPKVPKQKNKCTDASVTLGNPLKRSKVSAKSSKGNKEGNDVSSSLDFSRKSTKESGGNSNKKNGAKDATFHHDSSFKGIKEFEEGFALISKGKNKGLVNKCSAENSAPSLKRMKKDKDESAFPTRLSKIVKTSMSFIAMVEMNNSPAPPGFPPKCNRVEGRGSNEEDGWTIAEMLKSRVIDDVKNREAGNVENSSGQSQNVPSPSTVEKVAKSETAEIKQGGDGENSSDQSLNRSSSIVYNEALKNMEPATATAANLRQVEALQNGQSGGGENSWGQHESHSSSIAYNVGPENLEPLMTSVENVMGSEVVRESDSAVEDANQSNAGNPAHRSQKPIHSEGVDEFKIRCLQLEARIRRLEEETAQKKAARFGQKIPA